MSYDECSCASATNSKELNVLGTVLSGPWPAVWPVKSCQISIKVAQKWFH